MAQGDHVNQNHSIGVVDQHKINESISGEEVLQAAFGEDSAGAGLLKVDIASSSGGGLGGDSTLAEQQVQTALLQQIVNNTDGLEAQNASVISLLTAGNAALNTIDSDLDELTNISTLLTNTNALVTSLTSVTSTGLSDVEAAINDVDATAQSIETALINFASQNNIDLTAVETTLNNVESLAGLIQNILSVNQPLIQAGIQSLITLATADAAVQAAQNGLLQNIFDVIDLGTPTAIVAGSTTGSIVIPAGVDGAEIEINGVGASLDGVVLPSTVDFRQYEIGTKPGPTLYDRTFDGNGTATVHYWIRP